MAAKNINKMNSTFLSVFALLAIRGKPLFIFALLLLILLILILVFVVLRYIKARKMKSELIELHRYLIGFSMAEDFYIEKVLELEKGTKTKAELKEEIRTKVMDTPTVRLPNFPSDMLLKDIHKRIKAL